MADYIFKRGPMGSTEVWTIDDVGLSNSKGKTVAYAELESVGFADVPSGRLFVTELHLHTPAGTTKTQCSARPQSTDRHAFLAMCRDIASRLEQAQPDVRFVQTSGMNVLVWGFLAIGLGLAAFGLTNIIRAALDWGESGSGFGLGIGVAFLVFGILAAMVGSPWKKPEPKTPAETIEWIDRIRAMG